jgi:hypothetical protein
MPGSLAALGEQFIHQRGPGLYVLARAPLGALDAALLSGDAQFAVFDAEHNLISNFDAKSFAKS